VLLDAQRDLGLPLLQFARLSVVRVNSSWGEQRQRPNVCLREHQHADQYSEGKTVKESNLLPDCPP